MTAIAEFDHQVHPNRRDQTTALGDRIDAMTDAQRWELLHWLSGYAPGAVELAIGSRCSSPDPAREVAS